MTGLGRERWQSVNICRAGMLSSRPARRGRAAVALCSLLAVCALSAGCTGAAQASYAGKSHQIFETKATQPTTRSRASVETTTTTSALPTCGSPRDPFDPTGAPPPGDPRRSADQILRLQPCVRTHFQRTP